MSRIVLVHLSDIHVGSVKNRFYHPSSLRSGWNGHDSFLLRSLEEAMLNLRPVLRLAREEKLHLVVSGDLSCVGLRTDFALAYSYLNLKVLPEGLSQTSAGLETSADRIWSVPGNHDHWAGYYDYPPPAHDPSLFPEMFRKTPWYDTITSSDEKLKLDLFGIDSNSGFAGLPSNANSRAGGLLHADELDAQTGLASLLAKSKTTEAALATQGCRLARAIICHHSFSNKGRWTPSGSFRSKVTSAGKRAWTRLRSYLIGQCPDPLDQSSVNDLLALAWNYGVKAVLTGHTHSFWEEKHTSPADSARTTWELRCSTSLQGPAQDAVQGFFVHEIRRVDTPVALEWRYLRFQYSLATRQFEPERDQQGNLVWVTAD